MPLELLLDEFDPRKVMESGQCFRMKPLSEDTVETVAFGRRVAVTQLGGRRFRFDCEPEAFEAVWREYFDLNRDYRAIAENAPAGDAYLKRAVEHARGTRILRQEPWETLCGFILSQRKHLKAIRACVEALCDAFGEPVAGTRRRAFPTPERLAALAEDEARLCGLGYRTPYLLAAARSVASGRLDLAAMGRLPDDELLTQLMSVHGVGVKVAECVMLFGYGRLSRAPVDVWIKRVIDEVYGGESPFAGYGEYAGVYQQYLFILRRDEAAAHAARP